MFVVRRLLGIDRGRWLTTLVAVLAGEAGAGAIVRAIYGDVSDVPAVAVLGLVALATVFAMLFVVIIELLTAPWARGGRHGVPHPVRGTRELVRRGLRYLEVGRIVVRRGLLRRGGGRDEEVGGSRLGRSLRATFEDAGGLFVKLGQAMAQQPQLVSRPVAAELAHLQERAAPADPAAARAVIAEELGAPEEVFATSCSASRTAWTGGPRGPSRSACAT